MKKFNWKQNKPTSPGLNCLRMFARLEVDDQLPSPPVTKETPRSFWQTGL